MSRILITILSLCLLTACETTRQTTTNNIGATTTVVPEQSFNKKKAAANRVNSGLTYLKYNNFERAKFHLDKALDYAPEDGDVHYAFGIYFQRVQEFSKAEEHYKRAIRTDEKNPVYLNAFGAFMCERGEFSTAYELFERAIVIPTYTDVSFAYYNVGFCALKQNDTDKAEEYFRKALNRNRNMAGALIEMAKLAFNKERFERAMSYLKRYENNAKVSAESAWLALRTAHYLRDKDAIARYGTILQERFPDSNETADYLDNKKRWM